MLVTSLRIIAGVLTGLAVAFALVIAVELFSAVVHPVPEGFKGTEEEMCQHVANYPTWILAAVVPVYAGTALASVWLAQRIGYLAAGATVGAILLSALIYNVSMLPYQTWFKVVILLAFLLACVAGSLLALRRKPARIHI
jgi:H+/Cl- antiporter ClcA